MCMCICAFLNVYLVEQVMFVIVPVDVVGSEAFLGGGTVGFVTMLMCCVYGIANCVVCGNWTDMRLRAYEKCVRNVRTMVDNLNTSECPAFLNPAV